MYTRRALTAALASTALCSGVHAQVLCSDTFANSTSCPWQNELGNWTVQAGTYGALAPSTSPNALSSLPYELADFAVEFDVNALKDGGVWLRASAAPNSIGQSGVLLVTGGEGGFGTGLYWHTVTGSSYGALLNGVTGLFASGSSSARIKVLASGDTFAAYVNGSLSPATTLTTPLFPRGRVALYANSTQTFDNFVLTAVPEPDGGFLALVGFGAVLMALRSASSRGARGAALAEEHSAPETTKAGSAVT